MPSLSARTRAQEEPAAASATQVHVLATPQRPFTLYSGQRLKHAQIAYKTFGILNAARDNAILVFHALSGSAHLTGTDLDGPGTPFWTDECHEGWWDQMVGPGRAFDTNKYFVICANYLGSCYGSTGPASHNPETGRHFGASFPWLHIRDIVNSQVGILDALGIRTLHAVVGSSMGGFCALDFAVRFAPRVKHVIALATGLNATMLSRCLLFEQIMAIESDPAFLAGDYGLDAPPSTGLALARMISHKTFVSLDFMSTRARGAAVQQAPEIKSYRMAYPIESYILHQGRKFTTRFDANSYLRIIGAWQCFDMVRDFAVGDAADIFPRCQQQRWLVFSIDSDVCFYPGEQAELVDALKSARVPVRYITVHSEKGHDSFLLEPDLYAPHIVWELEARG